jgi:hypothetical protein
VLVRRFVLIRAVIVGRMIVSRLMVAMILVGVAVVIMRGVASLVPVRLRCG